LGIMIIRWASLTATPWKNGGGTAIDIAGSPTSASLDDFDWWVNVATIARSGPFSDYPGVDRDFRVLDGGGVDLHVEGSPPRTISAVDAGFRFPGDRPTIARLIDDANPCRAFNVLTRRGRFESHVSERVVEQPETLRSGGTVLVGVVRGGTVGVGNGSYMERLGELDAFIVPESVALEPDGEARLLLVDLSAP